MQGSVLMEYLDFVLEMMVKRSYILAFCLNLEDYNSLLGNMYDFGGKFSNFPSIRLYDTWFVFLWIDIFMKSGDSQLI